MRIKKVIDFIKRPHMPIFIISRIQAVSPVVARFLKYGKFNPNTKFYWDKKYQSGEYEKVEDGKYKTLRDTIIDLIPSKSKVLDAGCGTGKFLEMLYLKKQCTCIGLDISQVSILKTQERGFTTYRAKLPYIPAVLKKHQFDVCTMIETLEHVSNPRKSIQVLKGLLKESGYLIVAVPDDCMKPEEFDKHIWSFDKNSIRALINECGLSIIDIMSVKSSNNNYLVSISKKSDD